MSRWARDCLPLLLGLTVALVGCGTASTGVPARSTSEARSEGGEPRALKRVTASIMGEPSSLVARANTTQISPPGAAVLEQLVNASLTEVNRSGELQPLLAEAVPSIENGLWKVLPDGRMETTWKIRPDARWHDGTPLTVDDLIFTTTVDQDKDVPFVRPSGYSWVEEVTAVDQRTVTVRWNRPYIEADTMFTQGFAPPLPRHLLAESFTAEKERFLALPYWSDEFVGTGPFKLRELVPATSITLQAFDQYPLGRPKLDEMEIRLSGVAHLYLPPSEPEYKDVEDSVVRYEYDPRQATQIIQQLGYAKGQDGLFHDSAGERLAVELRSNGERITENTIVPLADMWTRLGVATEPILVPAQRIRDREYMATFPGFRLMRQPNKASQVSRLHSSLTPRPENRFVGSNYARYVNTGFDAAIDTFLTTIPRAQRMTALRQIMRHISENLNLMGVFYDADFTFISNRLENLGARETQVWDAHKWEAKS